MLVLLFRCYAEGYGDAKNYALAARYLHDAAELGDTTSQATLSIYHQAFGLTPLESRNLSNYLYAASSHKRDYYAMRDKC